MRKTKIVCTIGPACEDEKMLEKMALAGMDTARLNFSHGDHAQHGEVIRRLKAVREKLQVPLAIMLDTKGPEVRLGNFEGGKAELHPGDEFILTSSPVLGNSKKAQITYAGLSADLNCGDVVLIDDGKLKLTVKSKTETDVLCEVIVGGIVSDHKEINVPGIHLSLPHLGEQDKSDLLFGIENDVDYVSASFICCKEDVISIRKFLNYNGGHRIKIISKIENQEGITNFDEILSCSDGIMVARGDMGVEVEYTRLPGIQKRIIRKCNSVGKLVITATQMLESMIYSSTPTRAEITDVANAVFDGTSAIMLSGETAAGAYPLGALQAMVKIAEQAEKDMAELQLYHGFHYDTSDVETTNAICDAACRAANDLNARAVIVVTKSGFTAQNISKFRPTQPIIASTPEVGAFHQLSLVWGVYPVVAHYQKTFDSLLLHAIDCAKQLNAIDSGDTVIIVAGVPLNATGSTNSIKVEIIS